MLQIVLRAQPRECILEPEQLRGEGNALYKFPLPGCEALEIRFGVAKQLCGEALGFAETVEAVREELRGEVVGFVVDAPAGGEQRCVHFDGVRVPGSAVCGVGVVGRKAGVRGGRQRVLEDEGANFGGEDARVEGREDLTAGEGGFFVDGNEGDVVGDGGGGCGGVARFLVVGGTLLEELKDGGNVNHFGGGGYGESCVVEVFSVFYLEKTGISNNKEKSTQEIEVIHVTTPRLFEDVGAAPAI
jgi:hypothetical protein